MARGAFCLAAAAAGCASGCKYMMGHNAAASRMAAVSSSSSSNGRYVFEQASHCVTGQSMLLPSMDGSAAAFAATAVRSSSSAHWPPVGCSPTTVIGNVALVGALLKKAGSGLMMT